MGSNEAVPSQDIYLYVQQVLELDQKLGSHDSQAHLAWRGLIRLDMLIDDLTTDQQKHLSGSLLGPLGQIPQISDPCKDYLLGAHTQQETEGALKAFRQAYVNYWTEKQVDVESFATTMGLESQKAP